MSPTPAGVPIDEAAPGAVPGAVPGAAPGTVWRDAETGFEVVLPPGWAADDAEALAALNAQAAELGGPGSAGYVAAFRPADSWSGWPAVVDASATPPFALVQVSARDLLGRSADDIAEAISGELADSEGATFEPPTVSADGLRVSFTGTAEGADGTSILIATDGLVLDGSVVYLHRYADSTVATASQADLDAMVASFQPIETNATPPEDGGGGVGLFGALCMGVAVAAVVGACAALLLRRTGPSGDQSAGSA